MITRVPVGAMAPECVPEVRLLDARPAGVDEDGLRAWAHTLTDRCGAAYVARSYRYPYALIAWHRAPVGVDVERVESCSGAFADLICTPSERGNPRLLADPHAYLTSLWCSKEALSKALGDALQYDPSRLDSPTSWPGLRSGPWRAAALETASGHTAWLCWRSSS